MQVLSVVPVVSKRRLDFEALESLLKAEIEVEHNRKGKDKVQPIRGFDSAEIHNIVGSKGKALWSLQNRVRELPSVADVSVSYKAKAVYITLKI